MQPYDIIKKKRDGVELTRAELEWFVDAYSRGQGVTDYQAAAFCMATFFKGMSASELGYWTSAMLHSGEVLDLSDLPGIKVDKHSTGGVGDKVSLILAPLVAEAGVKVPMISGRGLGHTGGTLDKLESIPGFRTDLSTKRFIEMVRELGCSLIGQTKEIAPADKKLYALRDVTATVDSVHLIASSIMSKKLAEGIDALVLDVKCGRGAFMTKLEDARVLAQTLIDIGKAMGKRVVAHITAMDQPLGCTIGNTLEVIESVETLQGKGPADLTEVVLTLGAEMLLLGGVETQFEVAKDKLVGLLKDGSALARFKLIAQAQGGDLAYIDDPDKLYVAPHRSQIEASQGGFVETLDALVVGQTARALGAGRKSMDDEIDIGAGIRLHRKVGDPVEPGEPIATLYCTDEKLLPQARERFESGLSICKTAPEQTTLLLQRLSTD